MMRDRRIIKRGRRSKWTGAVLVWGLLLGLGACAFGPELMPLLPDKAVASLEERSSIFRWLFHQDDWATMKTDRVEAGADG